jgi:hypothetical protein
MIIASISTMLENEKHYDIDIRHGSFKGPAKVYVINPRIERYNEGHYMYRVPLNPGESIVDVIIVHHTGDFTSVTDKKVTDNKIAITKEKHRITLPAWDNINKIKAISDLKKVSHAI